MEINFFPHIKQSTGGQLISLDMFLNNVKIGAYASLINEVQSEQDKKLRNKLKEKLLPYVTISGTFTQRAESGLINHSGFICLDLDDVGDIEVAILKVKADQYTYAAFKSASGKGIAVVVRIDGKRHRDSFLGLERYYAENFQLTVDVHCKDVSRPRFVSSDPNLYSNPESDLFKTYLPREVTTRKLPQIISGRNDMDFIIQQIQSRGIDLTESSYARLLEIAFAIESEYKEDGSQYFHAIAQMSDKYSRPHADKQYKHCLKSTGRGISIGTFFFYCRQHNIELISPETKHIVTVAKQAKKGNRTENSAIEILEQIDGMSSDITAPIIKKVFESNLDTKDSELTILGQMKVFMRNNYNLKRNEVTRAIEDNGRETDKRFINSVYIRTLEEIDSKINYQDVERLIQSDFTPNFNPIKEWFESKEHITGDGCIATLSKTINSGTKGDNYADVFIMKWMVGIVASVYDRHSPLLLVLTGKQNSGKTEFFRRLMPVELKRYVAESKLDAGKDDDILMTQKILIIDDEMSGKSKQENKRLKELTSKDYFTLREPYGHHNVTLRRIAVLCGTSNDEMILNDPTGNRRIIPVNVDSIDFDLYNSIDKTALLMEAYHLFKAGYKYELNSGDIAFLAKNTVEFEQVRIEEELIKRYFKSENLIRREEGEYIEFLQTSEIKSIIEKNSGQKLSVYKIGQELKILGYDRKIRRIEGNSRYVYAIVQIKDQKLDTEDVRSMTERF